LSLVHSSYKDRQFGWRKAGLASSQSFLELRKNGNRYSEDLFAHFSDIQAKSSDHLECTSALCKGVRTLSPDAVLNQVPTHR